MGARAKPLVFEKYEKFRLRKYKVKSVTLPAMELMDHLEVHKKISDLELAGELRYSTPVKHAHFAIRPDTVVELC